MTTISEMFTSAINEALKSARVITDSSQKAQTYAAIAQALAQTGHVTNTAKAEDAKTEATSSVTNMTGGKGSLKNKPATSKPVATPEPEKAAPAAATTAEPELTEEWTPELLESLAAELEFIQEKQKQYSEQDLDNCVKVFSNNVLNGIDEINPINIKGFVDFIEQCEADQQASA